MYDGGALLRCVQWPKIGYFSELCENVTHPSNKIPIVVFDDYKSASTKDVEHKRRKLSTGIADIEVRGNTPIPSNKAGFLDN